MNSSVTECAPPTNVQGAKLKLRKGRPQIRTHEQLLEQQRKKSLEYYYEHTRVLKRKQCIFIGRGNTQCKNNTAKIYCHRHASHREQQI